MSPRGTAAAFGLLLVMSFLGVNRDLWTPDEPREAEISREMLLAPSPVPALNGQDFLEKPPLYYWTVAGAFVLTGGPSATTARAVSNIASFLTLVLVFLWGRRAFSADIGLLAAIGLATSEQFMISAHWVLIDPMLMLFMTAAAWATSEIVLGRTRGKAVLALYASLALALWTKGLIGPVLLASGLLVYFAAKRSLAPLWRLRPFTGAAVMIAATGAIAALIYTHSGMAGVREWFWVNHVQRFIDPSHTGTGHDQPFYYYLSALPIAVFPWWLPFADLFRPSRWRRDSAAFESCPEAPRETRIFLGALSVGMLAILSASATKRGIYLLPVLPPLFLLMAAHARGWWTRHAGALRGSGAWWLQAAFVLGLAAGPTALVLAYLRSTNIPALIFLAAVVVLGAALVTLTRRGAVRPALATLGASAVAGTFGLIVVASGLATGQKDMSPFVQWVDEKIPPGEPVYVVGDVDETVLGIVPFVTGRPVVPTDAADVPRSQPRWLLVQDKNGGRTAPTFDPPYRQLDARSFGPGRYVALWERGAATGSDADSVTSSPRTPVQ